MNSGLYQIGSNMRQERAPRNIFFYDKGDDSLTFIHKGLEAIETVNTGLALISLDAKGRVAALELMGARKNFGVEKEVLENLKQADVRFATNKEKKTVIITVKLHYENKEVIINTTAEHDAINATHSFKATSSA